MRIREMLGLVLVFAASALHAQSGVIRGTAWGSDDSLAVPHALVRLERRENDAWVEKGQRLTNTAGTFEFLSVERGTYRVRLLRIGFTPVTSQDVVTTGSDTARIELTITSRAIQLPGVRVLSEARCVAYDSLETEPAIAELWRQARLGTETRAEFEREYRFRRILHQEIRVARRIGGAKTQIREDTLINDPGLARTTAAQGVGTEQRPNYGSGGVLRLPDERELLNDAFLHTHCLSSSIEADGELRALHFEPIEKPRGDRLDVRGRVWLDSRTFQVERLALEYLRGGSVIGEAQVNYGEVLAGDRALRFPSGGSATVHPTGVGHLMVRRAMATFIYKLEMLSRL